MVSQDRFHYTGTSIFQAIRTKKGFCRRGRHTWIIQELHTYSVLAESADSGSLSNDLIVGVGKAIRSLSVVMSPVILS